MKSLVRYTSIVQYQYFFNKKFRYALFAALAVLVIITNILTFCLASSWSKNQEEAAPAQVPIFQTAEQQTVLPEEDCLQNGYADNNNGLYLMAKASPFLSDPLAFERKVRRISRRLEMPPEWLMAVIHAESQFDGGTTSSIGSGATGLIQWLPETAKNLNTTIAKIRNMNHLEQLDLIYDYLSEHLEANEKERFESLTEVYVAVLFPQVSSQMTDEAYKIYTTPSIAYKMNAHLDMDTDGNLTVSDLDAYLQNSYDCAYQEAPREEPFYAKLFIF